MTVLLGAIADDFTGATDLCNTLVRRGMRHARLLYARLFGPARRAGMTHRDCFVACGSSQ
ncbi:MAG TPA: four-carbon acid sugar kinase family protein [Stellaceae bacterium]|jgi:Sugar-binding N-terminal domain|nr:four-carbon acid sugar kinase family protein [Stellaceae bacterium]